LKTRINTTRIIFNRASKTAKIKKVIVILDYMSAKVKLELYRLSISEAEQIGLEVKKEILERKKETLDMEKEVLQKLEIMKKSNLSEADTKKVNEKLVKIQLNLLEKANNKLEALTKDFGKVSSYTEEGDFKFNFILDHELI
jgi:hypothetical protein